MSPLAGLALSGALAFLFWRDPKLVRTNQGKLSAFEVVDSDGNCHGWIVGKGMQHFVFGCGGPEGPDFSVRPLGDKRFGPMLDALDALKERIAN
jgi:hypothetical protein